MVHLHVEPPLHLGAEHRVTARAPVQLALVAVLDGEVYLDVDLRVEHLLAERAAVQVVRVDVHQVLLQVIRLREQLATARAAVLVDGDEVVCRRVALQLVLVSKRRVAFGARVRRSFDCCCIHVVTLLSGLIAGHLGKDCRVVRLLTRRGLLLLHVFVRVIRHRRLRTGGTFLRRGWRHLTRTGRTESVHSLDVRAECVDIWESDGALRAEDYVGAV